MKKFYVGSRFVMGSDWVKHSEAAAITHATELMQDHPDYENVDSIPIVQVVAMVERVKKVQPVRVRKVK